MARTTFKKLVLLVALGTVSPAMTLSAAGIDPEDPKVILEDATREIMRALELIMSSIPQYELPEVLENGDIVIRRVQPDTEKMSPPQADENVDETST